MHNHTSVYDEEITSGGSRGVGRASPVILQKKKKQGTKGRNFVQLWENACLQSGYSHEIDKRNQIKQVTGPLGLLAL